MNRIDQNRIAFFLPNVFTALNMACGFAAMIFSMKGEFYQACMFLFLGAIFDSVDGRVARLLGAQSAFGEQFDSLSDLLSFGLAPAFIMYNRFFLDMGRAGVLVSFLYVLCGALRLARFNANIDKVDSGYFQGLPIPAAAMAVVGFVLFSVEYKDAWIGSFLPYIALGYITLYGLLMISTVPFFSFKKWDWGRKHKKAVLVLILFILGVTFIHEEFMLALVLSIYVCISLVVFVFKKGSWKRIFYWRNEKDGEEA